MENPKTRTSLIRSPSARTLMKPVLQSIDRKPNFWHDSAFDDKLCYILSSATLYDERDCGIPFDLSQLTLESTHNREILEESTSLLSNEMSSNPNKSSDGNNPKITFLHKHILYYRGEAICMFQSWHHVNSQGVWGQSLSIRRPQSDKLLVHIIHKGRTSTGNGWNAHERRTYRLPDILEAAAERYKKQLQKNLSHQNTKQ